MKVESPMSVILTQAGTAAPAGAGTAGRRRNGSAPESPKHLGDLVPANAQEEGVVASVGLAAQDVEAGLGVGQGVDTVAGLGQTVASRGAEEGGGELDGAAGGVALVDLELAVELVV